MLLKHPRIEGYEVHADDGDADRWKAQGWLPVLDEPAPRRFDDLVAEADEAGDAGDSGNPPDPHIHAETKRRRK